MDKKKILILIVVVALIVVGTYYLRDHLTFDALKEQQASFAAYYEENAITVVGAFFLAYVVVTSLSLPGAAIMTLAAGALFGVLLGSVLVSFASTIGATIAFLVARYLLGSSMQEKYADKLKTLNDGIEREGLFYLFAMRLVPVFPFFLVNILMGLTRLKTLQYALVSQVGMLPGTIVYVNAGTQLSKLESLSGILSPAIIGSFVALGLLPFVAKKGVGLLRGRNKGGGDKEGQDMKDNSGGNDG